MIDEKEYYDTHYAEMDVQPIEVTQEMNTRNQFRGFLFGNMVKYYMRAGHKQGESREKDMRKFEHYMEWYIMAMQFKHIDPRIPAPPVKPEVRQGIINQIEKTIARMRRQRACEQ